MHMDRSADVRQVAVDAALNDEDLQVVLPRLARITRDRSVLDVAIARLSREIVGQDDSVLRRARQLLTGAIRTSTYRVPATEAGEEVAASLDAPGGATGSMDLVFEQPLHHLGDVAIGRSRLVDSLADLGLSLAPLQRVATVAMELMVNALRHAQPPYLLRAFRGDAVTVVVVRDASDARPVAPFAESPSGIGTVALVSRSWGVSPRADGGKDVWAVVADATPYDADER